MIRLTLLKPEQPPEEIVFTEPTELSVGRSGSCNCILDFDPLVSRMHAVFLVDPPVVRIKDLNSTNGLVINGETFGALSEQKILQPLELRDGDEVSIGSSRFIVNVVHDEPPGAGAGTGAKPAEKPSAMVNSRILAASVSDAGLEETVSGVRTELPSISGYRLTKFLSSSSMGAVYQAVALKDNTTVAIKVITPKIPITSKMFEDFRREIDNARRLQHPNLVKLLAAGELNGESIYLVTEFVHGENLTSIIETSPNGRISLHNSYNIILQLANVVCHLQTQGYLHMDLKPSSILIADEAGRLKAKITDQGFARFLDETGIMPRGFATDDIGKLGFIAPEELSPINDPKPTADVFSLSAVFYAMLTGRSPYRFESDLPPREVVTQGLIVPIEEALPGIPEPLVVIIERGLSVDADARYQNVCDLYEALESAWM